MNISLIKLGAALIFVTLALVIWLALAPEHPGHDHDAGALADLALIRDSDSRASCTHGYGSHRHENSKHVTEFYYSHRHGSEHHHHGQLNVVPDSGGIWSKLYDRQCPRH